jgi:hypothetical protein
VAELFGSRLADLQHELGAVLEALERQRVALRGGAAPGKAVKPKMTAADREEALKLLRHPKLVDRLREDFHAAGCVGEDEPLLVGYLAALSRKLSEPLSVLFCARSGAGKSNLQDRILDMIPPEELVRVSRLTGQALFYREEDGLRHKVLAIEEEGGAKEAIYSLRVLQSSGSLTVSATRTDGQTGRPRAEEYRVNGPTSIFVTTSHPEGLDYETRNRFVVLTIDESAEQTRRILDRQRWSDTLDGLVERRRHEAIVQRQQNVQRLIESIHVVNPFAPTLKFPSGRLILRREQKKYLTLIKTIALLHQHQRKRKRTEIDGCTVEYIEVTKSDLRLAQQLAPALLRRNVDELAPPTRSLLTEIRKLVTTKMLQEHVPQTLAFLSRQEIHRATGLSYWHLRVYLQQLVDCDFIAVARQENGKRHLYELIEDSVENDPAAEIA